MSYRTDRTASELQRCVSVIMQTKLRNPDISPLATITGAIISKDLKYATLYVTVEGSADKTVNALNKSAGFIRREVAVTMRDKRVIPEIRFKPDSSAEYGRKIDAILKGIENDRNSGSDKQS